MKIVKALEESGSLIEDISEIIKMEGKEKKKGSWNIILLGTLATSVLRNMSPGRGIINADEGINRAGQNF